MPSKVTNCVRLAASYVRYWSVTHDRSFRFRKQIIFDSLQDFICLLRAPQETDL